MDHRELQRVLKLIAEDDRKAFKIFFDACYPRFYQLSFYLLKSDVLTEEAVSDVFIKLWNNRKKLPDVDNIQAYLFTSVRNQSLSYLTKTTSRSVADDVSESMQLKRVHPESQLMDKELMEAIDNTVNRLPDRCKMVFRLVKEDNLSYKQAAEVLNISPKTVQAQMVIALKRIKDALKACEFL